MWALVDRFCRDDLGTTAVEYGLIVAGISVAIITVLQGIGVRISATLDSSQ